ncbi:MAG: glycerol-3-phosphate dehydrogenase/oxidase, partial [Bdellovibrionales bacterium]|nr:glycerol-3-phosphate dehydrogenase/oxidase [Bdellovibrionales bacterium]
GITGAGMARDAASRGMKVALVEMNDFASGTSSRSSKLIHGGIRYLENLEFHLVYEALSERALLFDLAPHLVHPLRFLLPLYRGGRVGMFKMGLGMWLYDVLSLFEAPEMHERLNVKETLQRMPVLQSENLLGSYEYSDAYMDDDRLVIETLRSAHDMGAHCANYVKVIGADMQAGKLSRLCCRDEVTGTEFFLAGHHFAGSVGPWTDRLASQVLTEWRPIMRPSKGIHLTLSRQDLNLSRAVVMASDKDKRIIFGIPRHEMVIIGTTDTDFNDNPENVHSTEQDVEYLLKIVGEYFPGAHLTEDNIIASYAGVRPLVDDGSSTESGTSREHTIINDPRNITLVAGGKYTTYRRMAKQAVDSTLNYFSVEEQVKFSHSDTKKALNPHITTEKFQRAQIYAEKLAAHAHITVEEMSLLLSRHGEEAFSIEVSEVTHLPTSL